MTQVPLLVVDMQNGFVNAKSLGAVEPVVRLIRTWHDREWPVYATRFLNEQGSQWEHLMGWTHLQSAPETDLHPDVAEALETSDVIVNKTTYTSLTGQFLNDLRAMTWDTVAICGIASDGCVLKTAVDLFEYKDRAIRPIVLRDACASHAGPDVHDAGLHLTARFIGRDQVITTAQFSEQFF